MLLKYRLSFVRYTTWKLIGRPSSAEKDVLDLLRRTDMLDSRPLATPRTSETSSLR